MHFCNRNANELDYRMLPQALLGTLYHLWQVFAPYYLSKIRTIPKCIWHEIGDCGPAALSTCLAFLTGAWGVRDNGYENQRSASRFVCFQHFSSLFEKKREREREKLDGFVSEKSPVIVSGFLGFFVFFRFRIQLY